MKAPFTEVHVSVDVRVQGVGYREFVRSSAGRFGVKLIFYTCGLVRDRKLLKLLVTSRKFRESVVPRHR